MTYAQGLAFLDGLRRYGMKPGLERMHRLVGASGHPGAALRFIHVAGTNGKGSTCAFLESACRHAGLKVGLFTSPHLVSFRERLQINREWIPESEVARLLGWGAELMRGWEEEATPTFFEMVTWAALVWFSERRCDLVVWETGLGGRLDATNIVRPEASVITPIGWDHMEWLGHTLEAIAAEKAGIIKPGVPVFTSTDHPGALQVLRTTACERGAPLEWVGPDHDTVAEVRGWKPGLFGEHQVRNAALAVVALRALGDRWPMPADSLRQGIESARWVGRFDTRERGGSTWVIDGAHNRPAFEALADAIRLRFGDRPFELILGMLADKELASAVPGLVARAARTQVVPVPSTRGCDPAALAAVLRAQCPEALIDVATGWRAAADRIPPGSLVVLAGSLYLVGEVLEGIEGASFSERGLNDWGRTR